MYKISSYRKGIHTLRISSFIQACSLDLYMYAYFAANL